jgi:hypothetical protein
MPIDIDKKINKNRETSELNDTIDQMDLPESYRIFHTRAAEYTFFSVAHELYPK